MNTAACTIITKRELALARVLMQSVGTFHPDWAQHVLLIDEVDGAFDPAAEAFPVLPVRHLPIPDKQGTLFFYDAEEMRAAAKPRLFGWLFDTKGFDAVVYLAPSAWVQAPLSRVVEALESHAPMVVTPHLLGEPGDSKAPGEMDVLRWGVHNAGFIAMSRHTAESRELLSWWQMRSYRHFVTEPAHGVYRDQRWLDLAAARWQVATIRSPGYNVAYWNLAERKLSRSESGYTVGSDRLRFFQFDGFDPLTPDRLSPKDERYGTHLPSAVGDLVAEYAAELRKAGFEACRGWPYAFDRYEDGSHVSRFARALYRADPVVRAECGDDPFRTGPGPFNRPLGKHPSVSRLMGELWRSRPDLQAAFPDLDDPRGAAAFGSWFVHGGSAESLVEAEYVEPIRRALERTTPESAPSAPRSIEDAASEREASAWVSLPRVSRSRAALALTKGAVARTLELTGAVRTAAERALPRFLGRFPTYGGRAGARSGGEMREMSGTGAAGVVEPRSPARALMSPREFIIPALNIAGYVTADLGVGQSARSAAHAAEAAGIDFCVVDFAVGTNSPKTDRTFSRQLSADNPHPVNLVHVNADQFPHFKRAMGPAFFDGKYTIGYWHWELPELPDAWLGSFEGLDEVWVPTAFVLTAVSEKSPVPVVRIPHAVSFSTTSPSRARLGLPEDGFLFLTMYDLLSYQERKNPAAAIKAFRVAFGQSGAARLVVKVMNGDKCPEDLATLRESLADLPGTVLLTETLLRADVYDLEATCDAFVSLHRSEGFGLGIAESMYLGKPVIATNWSGNVDFMNHGNSCPVDYELIRLSRDHGPYEKGQRWADADVDHAAFYMKKLVLDSEYRARLGARAQALIRAEYSPRAIGERYKARLRLARTHR